MKAIVTNKLTVIKDTDAEVYKRLANLLSYKDKSKQYQLKRLAKNPANKRTSFYKKLQKEAYGSVLYDLGDGKTAMSSGFAHLLDNFGVKYEDRRELTGKKVPLPWKNKPYSPRDYQEEAIELMENNYRGIINFATGLGKTLVAIHAIKRHRTKTLVTAPTESIAKQFYNELVDVFGEAKVGFYGAGKKKIKDITVGICASVNNNVDKFKKEDLGLVIMDECFPYRTNIATSKGPMEIGKLVKLWEEHKELPLIKSFNEKSGTFEYKQMTYGWRKQREDLLEFKISKRKFRCTPEHKMLTNNGWKKAQDIKNGELLIGHVDDEKSEAHIAPKLNSDQEQVVLGSFLGGGHLNRLPSGRYRLIEQHGEKQTDYCKWKASIFNVNAHKVYNNGFSKKIACKFSSKIFDLEDYVPTTKIHCPQWVINKLDARGLAIWFMDDGHTFKHKNGAEIAVCSFDSDSVKRLCNKLRNFGIDCKQKFIKAYDHRKPGYKVIKISKSGFIKLSAIIEPYVHKTMAYKVLKKNNTYRWSNKPLSYGTVPVSHVKKVKNNVQPGRKPYVFDIEVADNHNFVVCSRVGEAGVVAHNCHHVPANTFFNICWSLADTGKIFGLTATDYRNDGKDVLIQAGCGGVLVSRDIKWGIKTGWLAKPRFRVKKIDTTHKRNFKDDKINSYKEHVLNCDEMKKQILNDAVEDMNNGLSVLILVNEVAHGEELAEQLGIPFATGKDKKSNSYVDDLNDGKIPALVGTDGKVGEGTDTRRVDSLILANFTAARGAVTQAVGRGTRKYGTKVDFIVRDYWPTGSDMLARHASQRVKFYEEMSDDVEVIE